MNFEFNGKIYNYNYLIEDNIITISKKSDIVYTGNISDVVILCFVEKNILGAGQIVLSLPNRERVFVDGFRENQRSNYIELFQILKDKTEFLNLDYMKAMKYIKPEIRKEKEIQESIKKEQKSMKNEYQRKGFKLIEETKYVCTQCNTIWFYGKQDKMDDVSNRLISIGALMQGKSLTGTYHEQLIKDNSKCPKCGSRAITKSKARYWFNNKSGERVEVKE
jgi:hypothetical protein